MQVWFSLVLFVQVLPVSAGASSTGEPQLTTGRKTEVSLWHPDASLASAQRKTNPIFSSLATWHINFGLGFLASWVLSLPLLSLLLSFGKPLPMVEMQMEENAQLPSSSMASLLFGFSTMTPSTKEGRLPCIELSFFSWTAWKVWLSPSQLFLTSFQLTEF